MKQKVVVLLDGDGHFQVFPWHTPVDKGNFVRNIFAPVVRNRWATQEDVEAEAQNVFKLAQNGESDGTIETVLDEFYEKATGNSFFGRGAMEIVELCTTPLVHDPFN